MDPYIRKVQYYETDMMGIAHHANYIRWMEEARIAFMEQLGFPYAAMEGEGVLSPVRSISCQYKRPCTFADAISVEVSVEAFNGVVLTIGYDMRKLDSDELICQARSEHVFISREGRMLRPRRDLPEFCAAIDNLLEGKCDAP